MLLQLQVYSEALEPDMMGRNSLNVNTLKQDVTIAVETQVNVGSLEPFIVLIS